MKKLIVDSLNTTVSNSPPAKTTIRTPIGTARKMQNHKLVTAPSTSFDKITRKSAHCQQVQLLHLEIEQLRRENRFLKKKIDELSLRYEECPPPARSLPEREKQRVDQKMEALPLSVTMFFEEVGCLLSQVDNLFKMGLRLEEKSRLAVSRQMDFDQPSGVDMSILKPHTLQKHLERVMLEEESERFSQFLNLFEQFYKARCLMDKTIAQQVDSMTVRANELSKVLLAKYEERARQEEELLDYFNPEADQTPRNQSFTRKHIRNKSGQLDSPPLLDSSLRFFRRNKRTSN